MKAIIVINPGNPTGAIFSRKSIEALFKFAHEKGLVVLADEVYQENIYAEKKKFISFRKVLAELPANVANSVELISFHSCSKGFLGECGIRGGYAEMHNIDPEVVRIVQKQKSIYMGSNTVGQIMMDLKVRPPNLDECNQKTVDHYTSEVSGLLSELKSKANLLEAELKTMKGMQTNPIEGAMYGFPRVDLPKRFIEEAKGLNRAPDAHYCYMGSLD
jgi:alanine transaminase